MKRIILLFFMSLLSSFGYAQLPQEGFETGWTFASTGTGTTGWFTMQNGIGTTITWAQGAANSETQPAHTGERAAYLQRQNVTEGIPEDYLVTPAFNVPVDPELQFFSRLTQTDNQGSIYKVFIINLTANPGANINSPASYTELQSWTELEINPVQTNYYPIKVSIPAEYIGAQVRIAFMMAGDFGDRWLVDDVKVVKKCVNPSTLTAANMNLSSADLSWENPSGATSWDIELIPESAVPTGETTHTHTGTLPYHITGLTENTCYKYYVRANCGAGSKSEWVGAFFFCTQRFGDTCEDPIAITTLPYLGTDNTASFDDVYEGSPGASCSAEGEDYLNGNDVVYKYTAGFTGEITIDLTNAAINAGIFVYDSCGDIGETCLAGGNTGFEGNDVSLEEFPVTNGEDYYIVISTLSEPATPYTLIIQAVACDEPVGLPVENIGMTSAELSWTNPTAASSWQVVVQTTGSGIPLGTGTTITDNTNYLWEGLTASAAYEYWVRADCSNGTFSAWAGPYYFNTMACEAVDQCVFTFRMRAGGWASWSGHTMSVKQNGITIATLTGPTPTENPLDVNIALCNGSPLQLFWNGGGNAGSTHRIEVSIINSFGQEIYFKPQGEGTPNTMLYETVVDCDTPYCLAPKILTATNATQTTVDLGWEGPETGEWEYFIVEAGAPGPEDTDSGILTTTNPTIGAGPLVEATNYEFYVRMVCEDASTEFSPWSKPFKFSSSICNPAEKCNYDFVMKSGNGSGWLGSSMIVRQDGTNVAVIGPSFISGEEQIITVPLCHNIPFEIFWDIGGDLLNIVGLKVINSFSQEVFNLPFESAEIFGTVIYTGPVDCNNPACLPPTGLTFLNNTMTSIDLKWDGAETGNWEYIIVPAGAPAPTDTTPGIPTSSNPTVGVPLAAPATNYDYYVRVICTGASTPTSEWAGPQPIHSGVCNAEDKCVYLFELQSENGWGYENQTMTVYQAGVPVAVLGPGFLPDSPDPNFQTVEVALCADTEIKIVWDPSDAFGDFDKGLRVYSPYMEDVYIKTFGEGTPGSTLFTGIASCQEPACPKPQNLKVTGIGLTGATLDWDEMGTASSWEVWVVPYQSPVPSGPGTITAVHPFAWDEELDPETPYDFYVRAVCGDPDGNSTITGPKSFVTLISNDDCDEAKTVPVNDGLECVEFVAGSMTGATWSDFESSCIIDNGEYDVWYKFTAESSVHVVSVTKAVNISVFFTVYKGDNCGGLTPVFCNNFQEAITIAGLTPGEVCYIQVYATYFPDPEIPTSFKVCVSTPKAIETDNTTHTVEGLVQDVLVTTTCANVSNITWSTGTNFEADNGIAYFRKGQSAFSLEEGIVLTTGNAMRAPGPNLSDMSEGGKGWPGDDDLFNYILGLEIDPELETYNNATVLEFDFTPLSNKLKFPFIFASEEYGDFQCSFSDAFAFFLTKPGGEIVNLAVVPLTESPVSVVTIRNHDYNQVGLDCPSVNEAYFGDFYGREETVVPGLDPKTSPTNYDGHTIKMMAQSDVIPGETYHIKLVIADRNDSQLDSAVFVGPFNIGNADLGIDLTVENGNALCAGSQHTIESGLDAADYTFVWSKDGTIIDGETGPNLVITAPGVYSVTAQFSTSCTTNDSIKIEFYEDINTITEDPVQLTVCDADGFGTFDLEDNTPVILEGLNPEDYTVSYHLTEADAQNNLNPLPLTGYDNITQFEQVIYVRIINEANCKGVKSFSIVARDLTPLFTINENFSICQGTSAAIIATPTPPANYDPAAVLYSWTLNGIALPDTTQSITASVAGVYAVTINNGGCTATDTVNLSMVPAPIADDPADVSSCGTYTLPALSPNNNYFTGTGGTGTQLNAGDIITSSQVIYIFAKNDTVSVCTDENSFIITIMPAPIVAITEGCEGNDYVLRVTFDNDPVYNTDTVTFEWKNASGAIIGDSSKIIVVATGSYSVRVIPNGTAIGCPVTAEVQVENTTCLIPRGISPNGDQKNDEFDLSDFGVKMLKIFNRYGQEVYSKRNYTNEWKGQGSNGDELPTGTYYYMIETSNRESITGWVYINRQE